MNLTYVPGIRPRLSLSATGFCAKRRREDCFDLVVWRQQRLLPVYICDESVGQKLELGLIVLPHPGLGARVRRGMKDRAIDSFTYIFI